MAKAKKLHLTIRDVAKAAGCSHASVSRALRGEPRISAELREHVKKVAEEMGYQTNPLVASLMGAQNRRKARKHLTANFAWLNTHPNKNFWQKYDYENRFYKAAMEHSAELGFGFEEIWAAEPKMTARRLNEILQTRGINGLFVSRNCQILEDIEFNTADHIIVAIGPKHLGQQLWHRACHSSRLNLEKTFKRLQILGYERIGYAFPVQDVAQESINAFNTDKIGSENVTQNEDILGDLAGFYLKQRSVQVENRLLPFAYNRNKGVNFKQTLARWIEHTDIDALVTNDKSVIDAAKLTGKSIPDDLALAHLHLAGDVQDWAGIDTHPEEQSEAAVELLKNLLRDDKRGTPENARYVQVQGKWVDGWTAPKRS